MLAADVPRSSPRDGKDSHPGRVVIDRHDRAREERICGAAQCVEHLRAQIVGENAMGAKLNHAGTGSRGAGEDDGEVEVVRKDNEPLTSGP